MKNKGFMPQDDQGEVPIAAVEIVADTIVRLRADRELSGQPRVKLCRLPGGRRRPATRQRPDACR